MKICNKHLPLLRRGMTYEPSDDECEICKLLKDFDGDINKLIEDFLNEKINLHGY